MTIPTIQTLTAGFEAAKAAQDIAYRAMWAQPKNKALMTEFCRCQDAAYKAKKALAAAQDAPVKDTPSVFEMGKALAREARLDAMDRE